MSQTTAASISGRPRTHRTPRRGRRSFAAYYQWVDDALRHRADGYRLLDSPLVGLPGVRRMARRRFRRSAFGDVRATRALLQQATERAAEILTPRQDLALRLYCEGQPMTAIADRGWACAAANTCGRPTGARRWKRSPASSWRWRRPN